MKNIMKSKNKKEVKKMVNQSKKIIRNKDKRKKKIKDLKINSNLNNSKEKIIKKKENNLSL